MNLVILLAIPLSLATLLVGCKPSDGHSAKTTTSSAKAPPAKVVTENDLASIVLTPDAERRLGITTAPIEVKKVERSRALAGELLLPLGRAGNSSNSTASGNSIYSLLPAMTPAELVRVGQMQVEADGGVAAAQVELEAAKIALERAQTLVANSAGTQRAVDEARARMQLAEAAQRTARERRELLGAPLFDAVRKDVLWVRVSVYAGDLNHVNRDAPARVSRLGTNGRDSSQAARPVVVPFSPSAAPTTVELFYELDNIDGRFRPGEKVSVMVPLHGQVQSSVIPGSAVLYDIHGGSWVYENTAPQKYTRRRIEVRFVSDGSAVLTRGPTPGAKAVIAGAAELFGVEFGFGK